MASMLSGEFANFHPRARCVVLTTYRGDVQASRAFKAGAVGYLLKTMLRKDLIAPFATYMPGLRHVPAEIACEMTKYFARGRTFAA